MASGVKRAPRTRRTEKAERTRRQIVDAATDLFSTQGYAATTIEAIATRADVAVETVYSRFGTKLNLLSAILESAVVGNQDGVDVLELPEVAEIRAMSDQHRQIRRLAHLSRRILERSASAHRILQMATAADPAVAEYQRQDQARRLRVQTAYIEMLTANGPLRYGLTPADAADTYSALANPTTFAFLTDTRGWTADRFEEWLAVSLARLLLD
jgi:AcrR family transcriptional regulator